MLFPLQLLGLAILFRQTNIVWVVFVAGCIGLRTVEPVLHQKMNTGWLFFEERIVHLPCVYKHQQERERERERESEHRACCVKSLLFGVQLQLLCQHN